MVFLVQQIVKKLTNISLVNEIKSKINDLRTFPSSYYGSSSGADSHGTTHISILADDDAVSLTSTINL